MSRKAIIIGCSVAALVGIGVGVLIGYFSRQIPPSLESMKEPDIDRVFNKLKSDIKAENIRENLRYMTLEPHLAGTAQDKASAAYLVKKWKEFGIEEASVVPYDVLLSYPGNETSRNQAFIYASDNSIYHETAKMEKILDQDQNNSLVVPPFNAYTKAGTPESNELYYVNYGRIEDYIFLTRNLSINITGKIVITRYGKIFRGDKVRHADMYGAAGMLLYSDPKDYAPDPNVEVFPKSWWLPGTGVQRGTAMIGDGDPQTPGYPSTDYAYRYDTNSKEVQDMLPQIPCHPIGYDDARFFLESMTGQEVPESWRGDLNVTYKYGGVLKDGRSVKVAVYNKEEVKTTYNAVSVIRGAYEPDRYVILGNHHDAWVFGAVDPTSGTATLLEVSRVFAQLYKSGWRPRRSIVFCHWAAEEYGLIGSNEWVEEYIKNLGERAVTYINVDVALSWPYVISVGSSPLLYDAIYSATKKIPDPNSSSTLYDAWSKNSRTPAGKLPMIKALGSGSDYAAFFQRIGVPSVDLTYTFDKEKWDISSYPLYHSVYETFRLVDEITDPTFKYHEAIGKLCAELARSIAEPLILPMNVTRYGGALASMLSSFEAEHKQRIENRGLTTAKLRKAVMEFSSIATKFQERVQKISSEEATKNDPFQLRMINDQMMLLERAFTDPAGLPERFYEKHVVYAPSSKNTYASSSFPGLADALFDIDHLQGEEEDKAWQLVEQQLAVTTFTLHSAASTVDEVTNLFRKGKTA